LNIVIVFNPIAGAGRAARTASDLAEALRRGGHDAALVEARVAPPESWLSPALGGADVAVAVGGDGTVRMVAPSAAEAGAAIFHVPLGTENLFSREFGMVDDAERLLAALALPRFRTVDMGTANGRSFLLMVSVGYDAAVIHELARRRTGAISHFSYAAPMLAQFLRWRPRTLEVTVDGERIDGGRPGFVVIANSRQYARRLDPAREAIMDDGLLDVVFFRTASRFALMAWAWRCRWGTQLDHPAVATRRGRRVQVVSREPQPFQMDGDVPDAGPGLGAPFTPLEAGIRPGVLRVLLPSGSGDC